jgi:hypothetical protein
VKNISKYTTNQDVKESRHNKKLRKAEQVHSLCTASRIIPEGADKLLRISTNSRAKKLRQVETLLLLILQLTTYNYYYLELAFACHV